MADRGILRRLWSGGEISREPADWTSDGVVLVTASPHVGFHSHAAMRAVLPRVGRSAPGSLTVTRAADSSASHRVRMLSLIVGCLVSANRAAVRVMVPPP